MKTNCYHTRDSKGIKLTGGMLHAENHDEAAERATLGLEVKISRSGRPMFCNKQGREVSLYLSVHPEHTAKGQKAIVEYRAERDRRYQEEAQKLSRFGGYDDDDDT